MFDPRQLREPIVRDERFRIEMTVSCRDCDAIAKVANAGQITLERGERIQLMHNGIKVLAGGYYGEWMAEIITRLRGHHEPQEEVVFHEVLKHLPPSTAMIELGGFWSYYSLWFLQQAAAGSLAIVVEPDTNHLEVGRTNARLNGRDIKFLQASVGAEAIAQHAFVTESAGTLRIPQVTMPQLFAGHGLNQLGLLHCDAQGAETAVLQSCMELFRSRRILFCIVSTHSHHISGDPLTHQRCLAILKESGGQILAEHDVHESFSGDGLIAAYFGATPIDWRMPHVSMNRYSTSLFRNPLFDLDEARRQDGAVK
jgi:FkbM family methyltransferase